MRIEKISLTDVQSRAIATILEGVGLDHLQPDSPFADAPSIKSFKFRGTRGFWLNLAQCDPEAVAIFDQFASQLFKPVLEDKTTVVLQGLPSGIAPVACLLLIAQLFGCVDWLPGNNAPIFTWGNAGRAKSRSTYLSHCLNSGISTADGCLCLGEDGATPLAGKEGENFNLEPGELLIWRQPEVFFGLGMCDWKGILVAHSTL